MSHVATSLDFSLHVFSPRSISDYGMNAEKASQLNKEHWLGDFFCGAFDVAVIGDTCPDGRFLMKRIDESPDLGEPESDKKKACGLKRLVIQVTNRYDYGVGDMDNEPDGFNILLKRLARRKDGKVKMVGNNPFEARHAEDNMHGKFLDWTLIRPFGTVRKDLMPLDVPEEKRVKAAWVHHGLLEGWKRYMENNNLTDLIEYLPEKYGGPLTLRKYKFLVSVPYQVSFMKIYENLANGVVTYVPTPRYFKEFFHTPPHHDDFWPWFAQAPIDSDPKEWWKWFEFYCDEFKDYFYTFDSAEELRGQLMAEEVDPRNVSRSGIRMMEEMEKRGLEDWHKVLFEK